MAILELLSGGDILNGAQPGIVTIISVLLGLCAAYLYLRPSLVNPKGAPPLLKEDWPLVGTFRFFNGRWDFFKEAIAQSASGSFSFHVGTKHVVGISGDAARKFFYESKDLHFNDGYVFHTRWCLRARKADAFLVKIRRSFCRISARAQEGRIRGRGCS